jgi:hypothetical protein
MANVEAVIWDDHNARDRTSMGSLLETWFVDDPECSNGIVFESGSVLAAPTAYMGSQRQPSCQCLRHHKPQA